MRRFWRLQPAFYLTTAVTLGVAHVLLAPEDLYGVGMSALSALALSANFYFLKSTSGYATQIAENEPLLHTWSLAVEEQFYLLWPTLLLVGARVRWLRHPWVITALLAGLLGLSEWLARTSPAAAYYLLSARLVELGLGAALVRTEWLRMPRGLAHALGGLGLMAVLAASVLLHPRNTFPGLSAMIPCVGAALLIQVGPSSSFVTRLFEALPAVGSDGSPIRSTCGTGPPLPSSTTRASS